MRQTVLCIIILLSIAVPKGYSFTGGNGVGLAATSKQEQIITPMQALDLVKEQYATNFEKLIQDTNEEYYYKLPGADYYLVHEGSEEIGQYYTFHLYEFVLDEPDTGIGHAVTYGWYMVDKKTGEITAYTQE